MVNPSSTSDVTINELRVAQAELDSGNTDGEVYLRLSEGAVAFCTQRQSVQQHVDQHLRSAVLND